LTIQELVEEPRCTPLGTGINRNSTKRSRTSAILLVLVMALTSTSCVYFNAFYHARQWYDQAEKSRQREDRDAAKAGEIKLYQDAIKKCSKVISEHPGSGYVDDALFMIGKSFYYLGDFPKAERKFRELLSSFPNSHYAEESRFFLGKARFQMGNYLLAKETFEEFVNQKKGNPFRGEAIYLMGETALLQYDSARAVEYYQEYVKEYKSSPKAEDIEFKTGQIQFERKQFAEAVNSFNTAYDLATDDLSRYQAMYQKGRSLYMIDSVQAGLAVFEKLCDNQADSLHLPDNLLRVAEGNFLLGNEREAILLYDDITTRFARWPQTAEAYYRLGTIVQESWGDLSLAKNMYDQAAKLAMGGNFTQSALARSADITKVEKYRAELSDSAKDIADDNRFMLAELYRTAINEPDSALAEYKSLVENFPQSELAPRALMAIGWLYENQYHDSTQAREYYQKVLDQYPQSDEYGRVIKMLGLSDSQYDSVYADKLYSEAETQFFDKGNSDSAIVLFKRLIDEFPDSRLVPQADFAIAKIRLREFVPEEHPGDSTFVDSTMIHVFAALAEKYPSTSIGAEAAKLASGDLAPRTTKKTKQEGPAKDTTSSDRDSTQFVQKSDSTDTQRAEAALKREIDNTPLITIEEPIIKGEFVYPISASGSKFEGKLMLKIKIDYNGQVTECTFLKGSGIPDIDREVKKAMENTYFDPMKFDPLKIGGYFIYNYDVKLPEVYK
jgi:TonB family protein